MECPICYQTWGHAPGCPRGAEEEAEERDLDLELDWRACSCAECHCKNKAPFGMVCAYCISGDHEDDDIHVYPINDLRQHVLVGVDCPCEPIVTVAGAVLKISHNAFDHREIVEQAIDIMNGTDDE